MGRVSTLCNDAELFQEGHAWKVEGDPTEGALYPFAMKLGMDRQAEIAASPRMDAIPFESEHKFMATLHRSADGTEALFVKGAPEVILENCDRQQMDSGETAPLDRERFLEESERLAAQGERVLALAWQKSPDLKTEALVPLICRRPWFCWASSVSSTRRARKRSRRSRNVTAAVFASP